MQQYNRTTTKHRTNNKSKMLSVKTFEILFMALPDDICKGLKSNTELFLPRIPHKICLCRGIMILFIHHTP